MLRKSIARWSPINKRIFPAPPPSYTVTYRFERSELIRIPSPEVPADYIPALMVTPTQLLAVGGADPRGYGPFAANMAIIYCHGNGTDIGTEHDTCLKIADTTGMYVLAIDYPGYGIGERGDGGARCCAESATRFCRSAYEYLLAQGFAVENIGFLGHSIGTGIVCRAVISLALTRPPLFVGLVAPFSSIKDMVRMSMGNLIGNVVVERMNNADAVKKFPRGTHLMVFHGTFDTVVPMDQGVNVFRAYRTGSKEFVGSVQRGHSDFDIEDDITAYIRAYVQRVRSVAQ